jgi:NADH:ubiquinone oxidoreductase subunit E
MEVKKIELEICQGTSCHLLGSQELFEAVLALPEKLREAIVLKRVDCLKSCRQGPNVRMDGEVVSILTPERLVQLLEEKVGLAEECEDCTVLSGRK